MNITRKFNVMSMISHVFFILVSIAFIFPVWSILSISVSNEIDIVNHGYRLIPLHLDFSAYIHIFESPGVIVNAYKVTAISSILGSFLSVWMISMCAYALSRRNFRYRKFITFYLLFTMLFSGGLVPLYILMTQYLHVQNTYAALILPGMGSVFYLILMRTFFLQVPTELIEAGTIDGASEFKIYVRLIIPLSTPVFATIGLFQLLGYWNSWFPALLYITDDKLFTLQYLLQRILRNISELIENMEMGMGMSMDIAQALDLPSEAIRMAMAVIAIGPMLFVFPFFQKYFTKGMTVGSVK